MTLGISRIFRSTDVGAPVFTGNTAGSLKDVLKAVLVNGYGTTPSLGWTLEYETGPIAVFRSKMGTRMFLRIDDSGLTNVQYAEVSAFASMSSLNNGIERIPAVGMTPAYIWKYSVAGTIPWMILGDEAGFWILTKPYWNTAPVGTNTYANIYQPLYFGDYNSWDVRNKWNYALLANTSIQSNSTGIHIHTPASTVAHLVARGSSFSKGCVYVGLLPYNNNTYFGQSVMPLNATGIVKLGGSIVQSAIHLYETTSLGTVILGSLPGVFEPVMFDASAAITAATTVPIETVDSSGDLSIFLYGTHSSNSNFNFINKFVIKVGKGFRNVQ